MLTKRSALPSASQQAGHPCTPVPPQGLHPVCDPGSELHQEVLELSGGKCQDAFPAVPGGRLPVNINLSVGPQRLVFIWGCTQFGPRRVRRATCVDGSCAFASAPRCGEVFLGSRRFQLAFPCGVRLPEVLQRPLQPRGLRRSVWCQSRVFLWACTEGHPRGDPERALRDRVVGPWARPAPLHRPPAWPIPAECAGLRWFRPSFSREETGDLPAGEGEGGHQRCALGMKILRPSRPLVGLPEVWAGGAFGRKAGCQGLGAPEGQGVGLRVSTWSIRLSWEEGRRRSFSFCPWLRKEKKRKEHSVSRGSILGGDYLAVAQPL